MAIRKDHLVGAGVMVLLATCGFGLYTIGTYQARPPTPDVEQQQETDGPRARATVSPRDVEVFQDFSDDCDERDGKVSGNASIESHCHADAHWEVDP